MNLKELSKALDKITDKQVQELNGLVGDASEIFLIGNGGSNAIASHMAVDYVKFLNKKCHVPTATDMMSMIVNDYGAAEMYSQFITYHHQASVKQLAILISSSGNSFNIIKAANTCTQLRIPMILLSGFERSNSVNQLESDLIKLRYWVDAKSYGVVEMVHHSFLHAIV